jgi:hypothetical protein
VLVVSPSEPELSVEASAPRLGAIALAAADEARDEAEQLPFASSARLAPVRLAWAMAVVCDMCKYVRKVLVVNMENGA